MITFACEKCGKQITVANQHAGKKGKCPGCHEIIDIPSDLSDSPESPSPGIPPRPSPASTIPPGGKEWHCRVGGKEYGPISESQLKEWLGDGRVGDEDLVWTSAMPQWASLASVRGLLGLPTAPPKRSPRPSTGASEQTLEDAVAEMGTAPHQTASYGYSRPMQRQSNSGGALGLTSGGLVLFIMLILFCIPLCWLPWVIESTQAK
jgi:phage FluMu protein Com